MNAYSSESKNLYLCLWKGFLLASEKLEGRYDSHFCRFLNNCSTCSGDPSRISNASKLAGEISLPPCSIKISAGTCRQKKNKTRNRIDCLIANILSFFLSPRVCIINVIFKNLIFKKALK